MNRWLVALVFVVVTWAGAFGIAFAVVEWRSDGQDSVIIEEGTDSEPFEMTCEKAEELFFTPGMLDRQIDALAKWGEQHNCQ